MTQKARAALITQAETIRDETTTGANTATRVGTMDVDIVDSFLNIDDDAGLYDQSAAIVANGALIATNTTNISTNATNISTNTSDISSNASDISTNAGNIADLETVVTQRALYNATTTGTVALDCSNFDSWYRILTGNTDFTFTNTPASGFTFVRTLEVITTAGESLTFSTADNVIGTFVNDDTTVNLITINFANYPTIGLRVTVVIS